jgi:hypothetical protein
MPNLAIADKCIPAMSKTAIDRVRQLEVVTSKMKQVDIPTKHVLHAGLYARTILIPAGVLLTGALIKIATTLIVSGNAVAYIGEKSIELKGYNVLAASENRKQAFYAKGDTYLTMVFATKAENVEQAEKEFTDEHELLFSRKTGAVNEITVAGE